MGILSSILSEKIGYSVANVWVSLNMLFKIKDLQQLLNLI